MLIDVEPGESFSVLEHLKSWAKKGEGNYVEGPYVRGAWVVTGVHDLIAMLEADTNDEMLKLVTEIAKHSSPALITKTQTAVATDGLWG